MDARKRMIENFSGAASRYDALAQFQHAHTQRVFAEAQNQLSDAATIVDIGCGTGQFALMAKQAQALWGITGVDVAYGMCAQAATRCSVVQADVTALPFAAGACDAVVSSLCLQWVEDLSGAFAEIHRVLKPRGVAIIATLGSESLSELRSAFKAAGLHMHIRQLPQQAAYQAAATASGLEIEVMIRTLHTEYYPDARALLNSMRHIGAGSNTTAKQRGLVGAKAWRSMQEAYEKQRTEHGIPATWEQLVMVIRKRA